METFREIVTRLATTNTSSEKDGALFQQFLRKCGFSNAVVTCGIVYMEGHGTIECPPTPINAVANIILKSVEGK